MDKTQFSELMMALWFVCLGIFLVVETHTDSGGIGRAIIIVTTIMFSLRAIFSWMVNCSMENARKTESVRGRR